VATKQKPQLQPKPDHSKLEQFDPNQAFADNLFWFETFEFCKNLAQEVICMGEKRMSFESKSQSRNCRTGVVGCEKESWYSLPQGRGAGKGREKPKKMGISRVRAPIGLENK